MTELRSNTFMRILLSYSPIILLFISVLNEFDFNYLGLKYFSFNFSYILIFYYSLKKSPHFGYGLVFVAGLFNDVILGTPIGLSSLCFLLICGFAAYLRNITLRPSFIKDWIYFLITTSFINSILYILLTFFFKIKINYFDLVINTTFTFLLYFIFSFVFSFFDEKIIGKSNDY